ncbi:MAG: methionyl-tRNA formyltransferase [Planctomycetota bacterium]
MRVAYFGSGEFGLPTLRMLHAEHELVGIVTQPDKPTGRGKKLAATPIGAHAQEHGIAAPVLKPERVNEPSVRDAIRGWDCEAWVVIAFGQKLGQKLLADRFAMNLHASLLPRWRGAAPIHAAVIAGDTTTGVSVITLADEMDAGLILGQRAMAIEPDRTTGELHDVLARDGVEAVRRVLRRHANGTLEPREQDPALVTFAGKLSKADGWVDFAQPAATCRARVHGLTPWPGVSIRVGEHAAKLLRVREQEHGGAFDSPPGTLLADAGVVACGGGTTLRLLEVQPAGGRPMAWEAFANGRGIRAGMTVESERKPCEPSGT